MALWAYLWAWSGITKWLYHLDWNGNDSSGNSANGTATNITWQWGKVGSWSANYNWNTSYINCWNNIPNNTNYTAIYFVKWLATPINWNLSFLSGKWAGALWWYHGLTNNSWILQLSVVHNSTDIRCIFTPVIWVWYKIGIIWNWTNVFFAINWQIVSTSTLTTVPTTNIINMNIWALTQFSNFTLNWNLDEVIFENRAWSASEIRKNYTYSKWFY